MTSTTLMLYGSCSFQSGPEFTQLHPHLPQTPIVEYCKARGIVVQAYCPLMRGEKNQASLGEGAGWAGKAGFGWDHEGLKGVAEKVSGRFSIIGLQRRFAPGQY